MLISSIYVARSNNLSPRDHVNHELWSSASECGWWMMNVLEWYSILASSIFPLLLSLFFFTRVGLPTHFFSFFSGGWRAAWEPLLMDFYSMMDFIWWNVYVNDQSARKNMHVSEGTMFDQAQNVKIAMWSFKTVSCMIWLWMGLGKVEHEWELPHFFFKMKFSKTLN